MMSWLVDNPNIWYVLFGMVALAFAAGWWVNRRPKLLLGVAAGLGLMLLLWALTRFVTTDRRQLEMNVHAMADAAVAGRPEGLLKHLAAQFEFQGLKRQALVDSITRTVKQYQVYDVHISSLEVEELSPAAAKVFFRVTVHSRMDERPYLTACRAFFIKESEQWKVKEVRFYNPLVNQDQQITLPIR